MILDILAWKGIIQSCAIERSKEKGEGSGLRVVFVTRNVAISISQLNDTGAFEPF